MAKLVVDGKVAVLVSASFGAGWSTWGDPMSCLDGEMAQAILDDKPTDDVLAIAAKNWPNEYTGGVSQLYVAWVPEGEQFEITEYDGAESLNIIGQQTYLIA